LVSESFRVYTTLDLDLQRAASDAVRAGMAEVDEQLSRRGRKKPPEDAHQPQVALVVLDPHTGEIRALVGGRDYGVSQLNHVLARRQPGSSFKPFVYAAALASAVDGTQPVLTPASLLVDEPTTFLFGDQPYEPENYKQEYYGLVTLRQALAHSLNVATVRLAEMVGYDKVRNLAVAAGINRDLMATPAVALGAYVATPLEIASAYTVFANEGRYVGPRFILGVRDDAGETLYSSPLETRQVLDPRVAYLMVNLMETVVTSGTGAGVRSRGFKLPCAGKTGTSHDGWFVGFTPNLLAAVWVGYDDDRELKLSGAYSALPIWTEFMKRAAALPGYGEEKRFDPPPGIVTAPIDRQTNLVASADPTNAYQELFIDGTVPTDSRDSGAPGILGRLFQPDSMSAVPAVATTRPQPPLGAPAADDVPLVASEETTEPPATAKKGGVLRKFVSIFKGGSEESKPPPAQDSQP
jgi:penicillin-binding protein 1B